MQLSWLIYLFLISSECFGRCLRPPEDGRNNYPKHAELIGIINKPLLLHLVGVYIIDSVLYRWSRHLLSVETPLPGYRPATSWVNYTTCCKHSLVLLKMGEIIARNMLS